MAPKAVDARKRLNRNHRFRGHGPLLQRPACCPRPCRRGPCPRKRWMRGNASTGTIAFAAMGRSYNSPPRMPVGDARTCRRGPWPRKRWMQGNASTGTIAFAAMGRSYKARHGPLVNAPPCRRGPCPRKRSMQGSASPEPSLSRPWAAPTTPAMVGGWCTTCRRGPWPRKRSMQGNAPTGTAEDRRAEVGLERVRHEVQQRLPIDARHAVVALDAIGEHVEVQTLHEVGVRCVVAVRELHRARRRVQVDRRHHRRHAPRAPSSVSRLPSRIAPAE
jgi:hypothetical protein